MISIVIIDATLDEKRTKKGMKVRRLLELLVAPFVVVIAIDNSVVPPSTTKVNQLVCSFWEPILLIGWQLAVLPLDDAL